MGAQDAIKALTDDLQFGGHHFVVEANIKGYLDPYSYYTLAAAGWSKSCGWLFENSIVPDQSSRIIPASTSLTSPPK